MKCKCGCGSDVEEGKQYLKGHWSKLNAKKQAEMPKPEPKQPEEPKITFGDFRQMLLKSENVAWFKTKDGYIFKDLEFYCTVKNETVGEQSDYVAVVLEDGSIMPVVLLPGFAGIFDKYHRFMESGTEEKQPEQPEINDIKAPTQPEKPAISQPDEPKDDNTEALRKLLELPKPEKKPSLIGRLFKNAT